jgi:hypothetical protein
MANRRPSARRAWAPVLRRHLRATCVCYAAALLLLLDALRGPAAPWGPGAAAWWPPPPLGGLPGARASTPRQRNRRKSKEGTVLPKTFVTYAKYLLLLLFAPALLYFVYSVVRDPVTPHLLWELMMRCRESLSGNVGEAAGAAAAGAAAGRATRGARARRRR